MNESLQKNGKRASVREEKPQSSQVQQTQTVAMKSSKLFFELRLFVKFWRTNSCLNACYPVSVHSI